LVADRLGPHRPHLPGGLATKLANAAQGMYVVAEPAELADLARLVIEAAGWFPGRANDFAVALGEESDRADFLPDWLVVGARAPLPGCGLVLRPG
jgi:hypothetical protein